MWSGRRPERGSARSYFLPLDPAVRFYLIRAAHSVDMWLLILGVAGLFLRYLGGHSPYRRYLCDSSYFLYIAHYPVILAFQLLLRDVPLPPLAKIAITLVNRGDSEEPAEVQLRDRDFNGPARIRTVTAAPAGEARTLPDVEAARLEEGSEDTKDGVVAIRLPPRSFTVIEAAMA